MNVAVGTDFDEILNVTPPEMRQKKAKKSAKSVKSILGAKKKGDDSSWETKMFARCLDHVMSLLKGEPSDYIPPQRLGEITAMKLQAIETLISQW